MRVFVINSTATLVDLGHVGTPQFVLAMIGFFCICAMVRRTSLNCSSMGFIPIMDSGYRKDWLVPN